jgi:chemotaxis protein MotB
MAEPALKIVKEAESSPRVELDLATSFREKRAKLHVHASEDGESSWLISYADMMTLLVGFFVMLQSFSKIDSSKFEQLKRATTQVFGGEYKIPFEKLSQEMKNVVAKKQLSDQVLFHETDEGIEITFRGALFFDSGAAELRGQALDLLSGLIPTIAEQAKDFGIVVEGHTDNVGMSGGKYPSNWELSSVRACTVLRLFEAKGFAKNKLKALGWGDTKPIVPNEDKEGKPLPENQAQNRRVVIKILKNPES